MKLHVDREALYEAVQVVSGLVPTRSTKPILQNLKLSAAAAGSQILATDLEIGIRYGISGVEILEPGEVLLPARELAEILRETDEERIHIESSAGKVYIRTERSEFNIFFEDPAEFPAIPEFNQKEQFTLPAETLLTLSARVTFAVATEATRYAINGVLTQIEGKTLKMVGTDGKRLAFAKAKIDNPGGVKLNLILSTKGLNSISRIIGPDDKEIQISTQNNQIMFNTSRGTIVSLLVEGHFPNYEEVIPRDLGIKIDILRRTFESSLRKSRLMTTDDSRSARLKFADNTLTLSSRAPEKGESRIEMDIPYGGAPVEIGFDPRYVLDGLKAIHSETVRLELKDAKSPGVLADGKDYLYVIMPISLA